MVKWLEDEDGWLGKDGPPQKPPADPGVERIAVVIWVPILCPFCRSKDTVVTGTPAGTRPQVRYHKCRTCDGTFKSIERIPK